jgi:hypothetical protein
MAVQRLSLGSRLLISEVISEVISEAISQVLSEEVSEVILDDISDGRRVAVGSDLGIEGRMVADANPFVRKSSARMNSCRSRNDDRIRI